MDLRAVGEDVALARTISRKDAIALVGGKTEKPGGVDPANWFAEGRSDAVLALGLIPLSAFAANEEGDRYDGTVERARAAAYAKRETPAPPVIAVLSRDGSQLRILDGGHRISAARMRGDHAIATIVRVKRSQWSLLTGPGGAARAESMGWRIGGLGAEPFLESPRAVDNATLSL